MNKSAVYTPKEKNILAQLVKDNEIVENKKTDSATVAEKNKAWKLIGVTYNSQPEISCRRTVEQLRKLWNNLKQRKRKETIETQYKMLATIAVPPKKPMLDPNLQVEDATSNMDVGPDNSVVFKQEEAKGRRMSDEVSRHVVPEAAPVLIQLADTYSSSSESEVLPKFAIKTSKLGKRRSVLADLRIENARVQKEMLEEKRAELDLERVEFEKMKAELDFKRAQLERQKAEVDLKRAQLEKRKAGVDLELSILNLEELKKNTPS